MSLENFYESRHVCTVSRTRKEKYCHPGLVVEFRRTYAYIFDFSMFVMRDDLNNQEVDLRFKNVHLSSTKLASTFVTQSENHTTRPTSPICPTNKKAWIHSACACV